MKTSLIMDEQGILLLCTKAAFSASGGEKTPWAKAFTQ
jgi:hypothetical protein